MYMYMYMYINFSLYHVKQKLHRFIFTALHVMQTRYCDEVSVRPSVRLSVTA